MVKRTQKIRLKRNRSKRNLSKRNNTKRSNIRKKARFMRGGMKGTDDKTGVAVASSKAFTDMQPYDPTDEMDSRTRRRNARNMEQRAAAKAKKERFLTERSGERLNQHLNEKMANARHWANQSREKKMSATMKQEIIEIIDRVDYLALHSIYRFAVSKDSLSRHQR